MKALNSCAAFSALLKTWRLKFIWTLSMEDFTIIPARKSRGPRRAVAQQKNRDSYFKVKWANKQIKINKTGVQLCLDNGSSLEGKNRLKLNPSKMD